MNIKICLLFGEVYSSDCLSLSLFLSLSNCLSFAYMHSMCLFLTWFFEVSFPDIYMSIWTENVRAFWKICIWLIVWFQDKNTDKNNANFRQTQIEKKKSFCDLKKKKAAKKWREKDRDGYKWNGKKERVYVWKDINQVLVNFVVCPSNFHCIYIKIYDVHLFCRSLLAETIRIYGFAPLMQSLSCDRMKTLKTCFLFIEMTFWG